MHGNLEQALAELRLRGRVRAWIEACRVRGSRCSSACQELWWESSAAWRKEGHSVGADGIALCKQWFSVTQFERGERRTETAAECRSMNQWRRAKMTWRTTPNDENGSPAVRDTAGVRGSRSWKVLRTSWCVETLSYQSPITTVKRMWSRRCVEGQILFTKSPQHLTKWAQTLTVFDKFQNFLNVKILKISKFRY